jgi:hypothetical protein
VSKIKIAFTADLCAYYIQGILAAMKFGIFFFPPAV